jgi:Ca2+-binding RTX toxin-like protein
VKRHLNSLLAGSAIAAGVLAATAATASAATTATFSNGVLTVFGDAADNNIAISRNAAGQILVNGGAIAVVGGTSTVANTTLIQVFGQDGNDTVALSEVNGALPAANLFGGSGNDVLTGGSGNDQLFGQAGNDTLLGKGGNDFLFGGNDNDTLTGGDGDDQVFGQSGTDRMIWNPGDDTDLNEGGDGADTTEVNGGNGAEVFTATANGTRVRFDRTTPAPFSIDIGTTEKLTLNANGGDDQFSATGNLAPLIAIAVDGGTGDDTLLGGNGNDFLVGGDGNDLIDGNQGNDTALMGAGDDTFRWDPGDGSDIVEGQDGADAMQFNGANIAEKFDVSANGQRVRFTRDVGSIVMDMNGVETLNLNSLGGVDALNVNDLGGTTMTSVNDDLSNGAGAGDGAADTVTVNATNGADVVSASGSAGRATVTGLAANVSVRGAEPANDRLAIDELDGDDVLEGSGLAADTLPLNAGDGGNGDDVLIGGAGNDTLRGGNGDDVLIGGAGQDVLDGGPGSNVVLDSASLSSITSAKVGGKAWLNTNARTVKGKLVLRFRGKDHALPHVKKSTLLRSL